MVVSAWRTPGGRTACSPAAPSKRESAKENVISDPRRTRRPYQAALLPGFGHHGLGGHGLGLLACWMR